MYDNIREITTLKEYIECSLYQYQNPTRFDVLRHMFTSYGNGIEINENGFISDDYIISPYDDDREYLLREWSDELYCTRYRVLKSRAKILPEKTIIETSDEYFSKFLEISNQWRDRYIAEPDMLGLSSPNISGIYGYVHSKFPDLQEQVKYFLDTIESFTIPSTNPIFEKRFKNKKIPDRISEIYNKEFEHCVSGILKYREHIPNMRKQFNLLKEI